MVYRALARAILLLGFGVKSVLRDKAWNDQLLAIGKGWLAYREKVGSSQLRLPSQIPLGVLLASRCAPR